MQHAGRALKLVAVGLGQGGGNLAAEFHRRGYPALALNTAHTDLSSLGPSGDAAVLPVEQRMYIGIDGYDGAGADLSFGRECVAENAERIREAVQKLAADADVVVLTAGLGGGTGSAIGGLVEVLKGAELPPMIALVTLPHEHESGIAKVNAVRAASALVGAPLSALVFVDNARIAEQNRSMSMAEYYPSINSLIIEPLDAFNALNQRDDIVALRAVDGEDFRRLLLSNGLLNYGVSELKELSVESVMQAVSEHMNASVLMPAGYALDQASHLGIVIEASEATLEKVPFSLFEQVSEQLKRETGGAATYIGIYRTRSERPPVVRLLCASRALPERLQDAVTEAKREGGTIRDKLQQAMSSLDLGEIDDFELFQTHARSTGSNSRAPRGRKHLPGLSLDTGSLGALGSKPPPPPRADSVRPKSTDARSSSASQRAQDWAASADTAVATLPSGSEVPSMEPPAASGGDADREVYDRLVQEYLAAGSDALRQQVVQRLETDRCSDNTLVRYYAVKAMTKLNDPAFESALLAATEDEDRTVRAIATKALQR